MSKKTKERQIIVTLTEEEIKKIDKTAKENHLSSRANLVRFLLDEREQYKTTNEILTSLDSNLVAAKLSARQSEKNSTIILDVLNNLVLNNCFSNLRGYFSRNKKTAPVIKMAEEDYNERLTKYKIQNREQTYNKRLKGIERGKRKAVVK